MSRYFEIKILEPRQDRFGDRPAELDDPFCHPDRYRYSYTYLERESPTRGMGLRMVGAEGIFSFVGNHCAKFWGRHEAWIVREVPAEEFRARHMDKDRFELVEPALTEEYLKRFNDEG